MSREFGPSRTSRWTLLRDRAAAPALKRILTWKFERIIVNHGEVLTHAGHEAFRRAYGPWLALT